MEKLIGIHRDGDDISGSSIAKTFAKIMRDPNYINRMDRKKLERLVEYNKEDVVDLFYILKNWGSLTDELVEIYVTEKERLRSLSGISSVE